MRVRVGKRESGSALLELTSLILSEAHESRLGEISLSPPPSPPVHVVTGTRVQSTVSRSVDPLFRTRQGRCVYARVHLEERTSERALSPKQQRAARIRIKRSANKGAVTITNLSTCGPRTRRKLVPVPGEREKNR